MNRQDKGKKITRVKSRQTDLKKNKQTVFLQEINFNPDDMNKENKYYFDIAKKYRICKYIAAILAIAFSTVMFTVFNNDITVENFQYLIKDIDIIGFASNNDFSAIIFSGGSDSKFAVYRDGLAVVNSENISIYNSNGVSSLNKTNRFYNPKLLTSDKYMLVYDSGNATCSYSIFNSFSEVKKEGNSSNLDYPITSAAISDEGSYLIITHSEDFKGVLLLYDKDFNLINEIKKDKYILSAAITSNGKEVAVASVCDEEGSSVTEIMLFKAGSNSVAASVNVMDAIPMSIKYLLNGDIAVMFTDAIRIYSPSLEEKGFISFGSRLSLHAEIGDEIFCIVNNKTLIGNEKDIVICGSDGNVIYNSDQNGELLKIRIYEKTVYLLFENKVVKIDTEKKTEIETECESNAIDIVFTSSGEPILCYSGKAMNIKFEG